MVQAEDEDEAEDGDALNEVLEVTMLRNGNTGDENGSGVSAATPQATEDATEAGEGEMSSTTQDNVSKHYLIYLL